MSAESPQKMDGKDAESSWKANLFVVIETKEVSLCALWGRGGMYGFDPD